MNPLRGLLFRRVAAVTGSALLAVPGGGCAPYAKVSTVRPRLDAAVAAAAVVGVAGGGLGACAGGAPPQAARTIAPTSKAAIQDQIRCWFTLISS